MCKLCVTFEFLILSLYRSCIITPEQNLHLSAPPRTCSGRFGGSSSIDPAWYRASQCFCTNEYCLSIVLSIVFCTNICVLTRPHCAFKLSSPHRTVVAFVSIAVSAFPVTTNSIIVCEPRSSPLSSLRGPRLQPDWRNAWDSYRARYRLPLSAAVLPSKSPHTPSALGNRSNTR